MNKTTRPLLAALTVGLLAPGGTAHAAVGAWTPLGPDGGSVVALAVDPADDNILFAATSTTVFRTGDGGDSWSFAGSGLGGSAPDRKSVV